MLALVADIRQDLPRVGTRKLLHILHPQLGEHAARVERDYLFALLATHGLLVRQRKRRVITTQMTSSQLLSRLQVEHRALNSVMNCAVGSHCLLGTSAQFSPAHRSATETSVRSGTRRESYC